MQAGDFDNALLSLNRALQIVRITFAMQKDLAMSYYYKRDYKKRSTRQNYYSIAMMQMQFATRSRKCL
jgi:hypothetical protein